MGAPHEVGGFAPAPVKGCTIDPAVGVQGSRHPSLGLGGRGDEEARLAARLHPGVLHAIVPLQPCAGLVLGEALEVVAAQVQLRRAAAGGRGARWGVGGVHQRE